MAEEQEDKIEKTRRYPSALPNGELSQVQIEAMLPPGALLSVSNTGQWRTALPACGAFFCKTAKVAGGKREAALFVLKAVWAEWHDLNNVPKYECPISGLLSPTKKQKTVKCEECGFPKRRICSELANYCYKCASADPNNKNYIFKDKLYPVILPDGDPTQPDMEAMLPPGASCSVSDSGQWCTELASWNCCKTPEDAGGSREAALFVLKAVWAKWHTTTRVPFRLCPMPFSCRGIVLLERESTKRKSQTDTFLLPVKHSAPPSIIHRTHCLVVCGGYAGCYKCGSVMDFVSKERKANTWSFAEKPCRNWLRARHVIRRLCRSLPPHPGRPWPSGELAPNAYKVIRKNGDRLRAPSRRIKVFSAVKSPKQRSRFLVKNILHMRFSVKNILRMVKENKISVHPSRMPFTMKDAHRAINSSQERCSLKVGVNGGWSDQARKHLFELMASPKRSL